MAKTATAPPPVIAAEPKFCTKTVRHQMSGLDMPCGERDIRGESDCRNKKNHVLKYKTGFCGGKQCEGTRPKSHTGQPMKVCPWWLLCPCDCHVRISKMFDMVDEPRIYQDNPEYVPFKSRFWMPSLEDIQEALLAREESKARPVQIVKSDHVDIPDAVVREYSETESGRAPRGALEQNVRLACDEWIRLGEPGDCTTKWVSEWIYNELGVPLPSRGAIDAVWKRWRELGFCALMTHPNQFVCYTPDGIKFGLEGLKALAKGKAKAAEAAVKFGGRK